VKHCHPKRRCEFQAVPARQGERGIVLVLALVALLLIAAVGAAIIFMASSESAIVGAQKVSARSFYAGAGGLEEGRYRIMSSIPDPLGGLNYDNPLDPNNLTNKTQDFARVPALPNPGLPPTEILYVVNVNNPTGSANFNVAGSIPSAAEDATRGDEVPFAATFKGVASIQPSSGDPNRSVPYRWIRVNLKTEVAAQQDLNLSGTLDEDPIFLFMGRQYRASDLRVYDLDGPGLGIPGDILPPPWGCDPMQPLVPRPDGTLCPHTSQILDRPCVAVICATPVYMLTARAEVPLPGSPATSRLIRSEVAVPFSFSLDAAILSEPGITINGGVFASGRDICDPDCQLRKDGSPYVFPENTNFDSFPISDVPDACNYIIPIQSEAPKDDQTIPNVKAKSDPECNDPTTPGCKCQFDKGNATSCVQGDAFPKYDLDQLISILKPMARRLQNPLNSYYPQSDTSNLNCATPTTCTGTGIELGGFPFGSFDTPGGGNGAGADPIITYFEGDLKCTSTCNGAGILIVDGDLEFNASMAFYGVVLVRGNVSVSGGGTGGGKVAPCNIYGALITQGGVATDFSGSICFQYNSCAQRNAGFFAPALNLSFREMPQQ
jgi:hypothetical protein